MSLFTVAMLSSGCRNSHRCLSERHHASISEFEKLTSICAMTRYRALPSKSASTSPLRFSTPESMNTAATVGAARLPAALVSTSCVFIGSRRAATVQDLPGEVVDDGVHVRLRAVE